MVEVKEKVVKEDVEVVVEVVLLVEEVVKGEVVEEEE